MRFWSYDATYFNYGPLKMPKVFKIDIKGIKYVLQAKYSKLAISAIRKALRGPEGAFLKQFSSP